MISAERSFFLRTLGHPVLIDPAGRAAGGLRRKDLALLAYLCVERSRPHSRARLAALLWGESPEARARHSLTQALGRILRATDEGALVVERESVRSTGAVECDAEWLLAGSARLDPLLGIYLGPFLEGFETGFGSEEFWEWADGRRAELRNAAVRWLERTGAAAEAEGDWPRLLETGRRGTHIDRLWEQAHRWVMRAYFEMGERSRALRDYRQFAQWLFDAVGHLPDPETLALADTIRAADFDSPPHSPPRPPPHSPPSLLPHPRPESPPSGDPAGVHRQLEHRHLGGWAARELAVSPPAHPDEAAESPPGWGWDEPFFAGSPPCPALASPPDTPRPTPASARGRDDRAPRLRRRLPRRAGWGRWLGPYVAAVGAVLVWAALHPAAPAAEPPPRHGEAVFVHGGPAYLAYHQTLWLFPDGATLTRCVGPWPQRIRRVQALPPWPRRTLPSVLDHPWLGGVQPVTAESPVEKTQYVTVGCVLAPIPDPAAFRRIFGHPDGRRGRVAADGAVHGSPRTRAAGGYPARPAGTLIRGARGQLKWIVFHGGALSVAPSLLAGYHRSVAESVRVPDAEFRYYRAFAALPRAHNPCGLELPQRR